jgi:transcriptional regulator of aromatic amino acid metabolism
VLLVEGPGRHEPGAAEDVSAFFTTRARPRLGMGLAVVRDIVPARWDVEVDSEPRPGDKMTVTLPMRPIASVEIQYLTPKMRIIDHPRRRRLARHQSRLLAATLVAGYDVHTTTSSTEAIRLLDELDVDLVVTDLRMPEVDGLDLVRHVKENLKDTGVIVVTAFGTVSGAVTAVKLGATEYLMKPYSGQELLEAAERVLDQQRRNRALMGELGATSPMHDMLGSSPRMQEVFRAVKRAAASDATVLITGESGTGKELVAKAIHRQSARALGPLVPVNCGAIPQELFENELFGHAKGAFTGASESHPGFFQAAEQTCFSTDQRNGISSR